MSAARIVDYLSGAVPGLIQAHLSVDPLPEPPDLSTIVEASWLHYGPAPMAPFRQVGYGAEWADYEGVAGFFVGDATPPTVRVVYLTVTPLRQPKLIWAQSLPLTLAPNFFVGPNYVTITIRAFGRATR